MIDYQHIVGRQRRSYKVKMWHCDMGFSHYDEVPLFSISSAFSCVRHNYAWLVKVDSSSSASLEEVWLPDKLILSPLTWWDPQFWLWRCCCSYSSSVGSSSPQFASTCPAHCETPWSGSTIYHKQLHEEGNLINCAWKSWVYTNLTCLSPAVMRKALLESKIIEVTGSECGSLILSVSKKHESWSCYVMLCKSFEGSSNDFLNRALPVHSPVVAEKNAMLRSWSYRYIYYGLCD